jgi:hypothetical protein
MSARHPPSDPTTRSLTSVTLGMAWLLVRPGKPIVQPGRWSSMLDQAHRQASGESKQNRCAGSDGTGTQAQPPKRGCTPIASSRTRFLRRTEQA